MRIATKTAANTRTTVSGKPAPVPDDGCVGDDDTALAPTAKYPNEVMWAVTCSWTEESMDGISVKVDPSLDDSTLRT